MGRALASRLLQKIDLPRIHNGDQRKPRLRKLPAASGEIMDEGAKQLFESRRPLVALAGRVNDQVMSDAGNLVALAELTQQLATDFGLRITAKATGKSRVVRGVVGGELGQPSVAGEQQDLLFRH